MTIIIASLALFIAMIALWLASTNVKKIEGGNKELKSQINADIDKVKKEILNKIDALDKKAGAFDGKMEGSIEGQNQAKETVVALEKQVARVSQDLKNLINGLPPQFRSNRAGPAKSEFG